MWGRAAGGVAGAVLAAGGATYFSRNRDGDPERVVVDGEVGGTSGNGQNGRTENIVERINSLSNRQGRAQSKGTPLLQVTRAVLLMRHGDRTPIDPPAGHVLPAHSRGSEAVMWERTLPTEKECQSWLSSHPLSSPTQPRIDEGCRPWGQLTRVGAYQARDLGEWLRRRYVEARGCDEAGGEDGWWSSESTSVKPLLPSQLNPSCLRTHSTSIYRSQQTLQNLLFGLYPHTTRTEGSDKILINVTSDPDKQEFLYSPDRNKCRRLAALHAQVADFERGVASLTDDEAAVVRKLGLLFGYEQLKLTSTRSTLVCLRSHGRDLPEGVSHHDVRLLEQANAKLEFRKYASKEYFRLALGQLIPHLLGGLGGHDGAPGNSARLTIFSGHDSTIKPLATVLGLGRYDEWPPYCSSILIEYAEPQSHVNQEIGTGTAKHAKGKGSGAFVRILFNREPQSSIVRWKDDNVECAAYPGGWIPYDAFVEQMQSFAISPQDHSALCNKLGDLR